MAKDKIDTRKKYRVGEKLGKHTYFEDFPQQLDSDYYGRPRYIEGRSDDRRKYLDFGTDKRGALKYADKKLRSDELMYTFGNTKEFSERSINEKDPEVEVYYRKKKASKKPVKRKPVKKCKCKK